MGGVIQPLPKPEKIMTDQDAYEKMSELQDVLDSEVLEDLDRGLALATRALATRDEMSRIEQDFPGTLEAVQEAHYCEIHDI